MSNGEMAPLSQFITLTKVYGAESLARFNMYNSIAVNAVPANGYSSGDAIKAVKETAATSLPKGYGYDFGSITREENQQSNTTTIIFGICILMIYLILSALYESFLVPFAVILSVPMGLMGSFLFAKFMGLENNIYLQNRSDHVDRVVGEDRHLIDGVRYPAPLVRHEPDLGRS